MRRILALFSVWFAAPALAQAAPDSIQFTFTGTVTHAADSTVTVKNPNGTTNTLTGAQIPAYAYAVGDPITMTFAFAANQPAFQDASCNGHYDLVLTGGSGACSVPLDKITTPFGQVGLGGFGGDSPGGVSGLQLVRDPATGAFSIALPTGSYSMQYLGVNPYYYNSSTGQLLPPNGNPCVDAFNCPVGVVSGTATTWSTPIPIAGDFGTYKPGYYVGYAAGTAGLFSVTGKFLFGSGGVDVPEPSVVGLLALSVVTLATRRRRAMRA